MTKEEQQQLAERLHQQLKPVWDEAYTEKLKASPFFKFYPCGYNPDMRESERARREYDRAIDAALSRPLDWTCK